MTTYSAILLSGGSGKRLRSKTPKQYLELCDKVLALYSFETFLSLNKFEEICVVCEEKYQKHFLHKGSNITFAKPGIRRQDSVKSGLKTFTKQSDFTVIHDIARPFVKASSLEKLLSIGASVGAATLASKVTSTIKQTSPGKIVSKTLNRDHLWNIQTPQIVRTNLLIEGFQKVDKQNLTITDDVSIAEYLEKPVRIIENSPNNFKVTTPEDFAYAKFLIDQGIDLG